MKNKSLLITFALLSNSPLFADEAPTGFLDVSSNTVLAGTHVDLNWKINLPATSIEELIDFDNEERQIIPREDVIAEVRVLGAAMGPANNPLYGEAEMNAGGTGFINIFAAFADGINAGDNFTYPIAAGESLDFIFKTWNGSSPNRPRENWGSLRTPVTTGNSDPRLFILKDGDTVPIKTAAFDQEAAEAFVAPYLEEDGLTLKLGPNDLILFAELNETVNNISDFQDFVVLVNFTRP